MGTEQCGARDGSWTCARGSGHSGDHRAIGRDLDYHWTNPSDLLRERDELRAALQECFVALGRFGNVASGPEGAAWNRARAVLSKVTP